jgi:hypothetical protein
VPTTPVADDIRQALTDAGLVEAGGTSAYGFVVWMATTGQFAYVSFAPNSTFRLGNAQVSRYVRVLQDKGFRVLRMKGVQEVDKLMVRAI